jgi:hypothetical protein
VTTFRRWTAAWAGGSVLGIANGVLRERVLRRRLDEPHANRLSAVSLIALLALYLDRLQRRWPIPTARGAAEIGATWAALTVLFEFAFGHYVDRKSWEELVANYDLRSGHLWPLVLLWIGIGPAVARSARGS